MKFTQLSFFYLFHTTLTLDKSLENSGQQMFIKVSSIFKEEKYQSSVSKNQIRTAYSSPPPPVHHLHHTTALQEISKPLEISA